MPDLTEHDIEMDTMAGDVDAHKEGLTETIPPHVAKLIEIGKPTGLEQVGWINKVDRQFLLETDNNARIVAHSTEGLYKAVYCYKDGKDEKGASDE